jgi:sugar O-acyltransferase (sialic acid O-acetyltransferase NeuD family)
MKPVLIFGAGQVAEVIAEGLASHPCVFVVDDRFERPITEGKRTPITLSQLAAFHDADASSTQDYLFVIGMSFRGLNKARSEKFNAMRTLGYKPVGLRGIDVWVPNSAKIGEGTTIQTRNTIQTGVEIGENCMLWAGNHIGHHTKIGSHVWLSSGIVVSGACEIGDYTFIGSGVTIADNIKIGKRCIIGAGATITRDCEDDGVYPGPYAVRSKVPSNKVKGVWAQ